MPFEMLLYTIRSKWNVVGVTIEVRRHGNAERGRSAGCKSWRLKNVIFTLATESHTPAPTRIYLYRMFGLLYSTGECKTYC